MKNQEEVGLIQNRFIIEATAHAHACMLARYLYVFRLYGVAEIDFVGCLVKS